MAKFNNFANNFRGLIHSGSLGDSGLGKVAKENKTPGVTKIQSFEKRQQIDKSRRQVGNYRDAGVIHEYKQVAKTSVQKASYAKHSDHDVESNDLIPLSNRQKMKYLEKSKDRRDEIKDRFKPAGGRQAANARSGQPNGAAIKRHSFTEPKSRFK